MDLGCVEMEVEVEDEAERQRPTGRGGGRGRRGNRACKQEAGLHSLACSLHHRPPAMRLSMQ